MGDALSVTMDPQCNCTSVEDCMSTWILQCDHEQTSVFDGQRCEGQCCSGIAEQVVASYVENDCVRNDLINDPRTQFTLLLCGGGLILLCATVLCLCCTKRKTFMYPSTGTRTGNMSIMS